MMDISIDSPIAEAPSYHSIIPEKLMSEIHRILHPKMSANQLKSGFNEAFLELTISPTAANQDRMQVWRKIDSLLKQSHQKSIAELTSADNDMVSRFIKNLA